MLVRSAAVCLGLCLLLPLPPLSAQGPDLELSGFVGASLFLSDLSPGRDATFGTSTVQDLIQYHESSFAVGGRLGVDLGPVTVEGTVAYFPTEITTEGNTTFSSDQTILLFGADLLLEKDVSPFLGLFLAGGVGMKTYSSDDPFPEIGLSPSGFESGSDVMFDVGGGLRLGLFQSAAIRLDVRDYISSFEVAGASEMQHDLLVSVGLSWRPTG